MGSRDDIVTVGATDEQDCKAYFSDYGSWVDISAPGVAIWSLYHDHFDPATDYVAALDGTSMACPLAASVAALIWSNDPSLQADQVKQILLQSADPIDSLPCNAAYYTGKLGAGRINAFQALNTQPPPPTSYVTVNELTTGRYQTTGKGKNKTTMFVESSNFKAGDEVVIRAAVVDENGTPVSNATVNITIAAMSGPGNPEFATEPSNNTGMAEFLWTGGSYEVKLTDVIANGYVWDGNSTQARFVIQ
jgi:subtilisin family serine protease